MNEDDKPLDIFEQTIKRRAQEMFAIVDAEHREREQQEVIRRLREEDARRREAILMARGWFEGNPDAALAELEHRAKQEMPS
jgi:hypothetical protein